MVDFRVDDGFPNHPKALGIPMEAVGVWTFAGAWCARYLTDGYIPTEAMRAITGRDRPIQELLNRGLLIAIEGGYQFPDWLDYQRSRADVQTERQRNAERQARYRAKRDETRDTHTHQK